MIKVDMRGVKIAGPKVVLIAELTMLLRTCREELGEEVCKCCVETASLSLSEEKFERGLDEKIDRMVKTILGIKEDK